MHFFLFLAIFDIEVLWMGILVDTIEMFSYQYVLFATAHLLAIVIIPSVYLIYSKLWFS